MSKHQYFMLGNLLLRIVLLCLFSSDYKDVLFVPFLDVFVQDLHGNPWEFVYTNHLPLEFPYPPLTLWTMALFYVPLKAIGLGKVLFILPLVLFDFVLYRSLQEISPAHRRLVATFHLLSPIVLYSTYMHSQLDMISISLLMVSMLFLHRKQSWRAILFLALAASSKAQIIAVIPLIVIYFLRNRQFQKAFAAVTLPIALNLLLAAPYLNSDGFASLVLNNPKQNSIFGSFVAIDDVKIFLPVLAVLVLYGRFATYRKVNLDLLLNFIGITFTAFLMLVKPSPGWYMWVAPFLTLLLVRQTNPWRSALVFAGLNAVYLTYFLFFHTFDHEPLKFLDTPVVMHIANARLASICFTILTSAMLLCAWMFYKTGIRSNAAYRMLQAFAIGIGGDSGSGKTTLLADMKSLFGLRLLELEGDGEHRWERGNANWQTMTHLDPKANLLHDQAGVILSLKRGQPAYRRDYNHHTGKFTDPILLKPADFLLISGLHPFYLPIMRKVLDLKIFMQPDEALRLHWKILRDTAGRGYTRETILKQIRAREEDRLRYIAPQAEYADFTCRFFSRDPFEPGDPQASPTLSLEIILDASINLESVCSELVTAGYEVEWSYSDDLKNQVIVLHGENPSFDFGDLAVRKIINLDELVQLGKFECGHRGFLQFMILLVVSQKLRGDLSCHDSF